MTRLLASILLCALAPMARADKLVLVAGGGDGGEGAFATEAKLIQPFGVDFLGDNIVVVEMAKGERVRTFGPQGRIATLAGKVGEKGDAGDGGPGSDARFNGIHSLAVGPDEQIYVADTWNNRVRIVERRGLLVKPFAGTGGKGFSGDGGPAAKAKFGGCFCVGFDPAGKNCFITDLDNRRIRKVELATGIVTTVAGSGEKGVPKNGEQATNQPLVDPRAHAVDAKGNLYILERGGHALRAVDAKGAIRTVAGTGKAGRSTGPALESAFNGPKHLCIDKDGSVLIADTENHRIVRYVPGAEKLVAVAGTGKQGTAGLGGDPLKAEFNQPHGVNVHPKSGAIYISDASNGRVLKIERE